MEIAKTIEVRTMAVAQTRTMIALLGSVTGTVAMTKEKGTTSKIDGVVSPAPALRVDGVNQAAITNPVVKTMARAVGKTIGIIPAAVSVTADIVVTDVATARGSNMVTLPTL